MQKRMRPISSHLDRTSLVNIKDLLYDQKDTPKNFTFAGTKRAILSGQDRPILPAWVANYNTGFTSSCPVTEPAIQYFTVTEAINTNCYSVDFLYRGNCCIWNNSIA